MVVPPEEAPGGLGLTTYEYDDTSQLATVETTTRTNDSGGTAVTTNRLDWLGRTYQVEAAGPHDETVVQEFAFGKNGQLASRSLPYFEVELPAEPDPQYTVFEYDPLGRETKATLPGAGRIYQTSTVKGLVTSTDPLGVEKRTQLSPFGQVVTVEEDNLGATYTTEYRYNVAGELEWLEDEYGSVTDPEWDRAGRKVSLLDPDVGSTTFSYYPDGSLASQTDAATTVVSFEYDAIGRVLWRKIDGVTDFTFDYDTESNGQGRLAKRTRSDGYEYRVLEYDLLGRPVEERYHAGGALHTFTNAYTQAGQLEVRSYPTGTVTRTFDAAGFLTDISLSGGEIANNLVWHPTGALEAWTSGNWYRTERTFEADTARLDTLTVSDYMDVVVEEFDYGYTVRDRVATINDRFNSDPARDRSFVYDPLGRLTSATGPYEDGYTAKTLLYDYDKTGNLLCKGATDLLNCQSTGGMLFAGYRAPDGSGIIRAHAPTTIDGAVVQHDALGNLTERNGKTFEYNALGQLAGVEITATQAPELSDVRYDFDGRRTDTVDHSSGSGIARHLITPDFEWVAGAVTPIGRIHVSLAGTHIATYEKSHDPGGCAAAWPMALVPDPGDATRNLLVLFSPALFAMALVVLGGPVRRRIPSLRPVGALALGTIGIYLFAVNGQLVFFGPLTREASAGPPQDTWFYHSDHLGSTSLLTYRDMSIVGRTVYKPFGEVVPSTAGGSTDAPNWGFTSQRYEKAAGIYDYNARWYDPEMGRFLQPDSIVPDPYASQSLNRYAYVGNDPVNMIDPTGHSTQWQIAMTYLTGGKGGPTKYGRGSAKKADGTPRATSGAVGGEVSQATECCDGSEVGGDSLSEAEEWGLAPGESIHWWSPADATIRFGTIVGPGDAPGTAGVTGVGPGAGGVELDGGGISGLGGETHLAGGFGSLGVLGAIVNIEHVASEIAAIEAALVTGVVVTGLSALATGLAIAGIPESAGLSAALIPFTVSGVAGGLYLTGVGVSGNIDIANTALDLIPGVGRPIPNHLARLQAIPRFPAFSGAQH